MIAAIYARKSTEQNGVSNDQKSVTRQIEHATAYALKKGWTVSEDHIYSDDGISGAEFVKRPGFIRPMNALKPALPFQILIMNEESRLGREQIKTVYALQRLTDTGVQVWFYLSNQERKLDTAMDKIMGSLTGFASEIEREQAQQRTYDAMMRKAKAGHVTGGSVFGYDNIDIVGTTPDAQGRAKRSHVELRINEAEAGGRPQDVPALRGRPRLHEHRQGAECRGGHLPTPLLQQAARLGEFVGPSSDSASSLRGGSGPGAHEEARPAGVKRSQQRPEHKWIIVHVPQLQVVPPELWKEVQDHWKNVRQLYLRATDGRLHGRPTNGHESPYLLTGFTACKECKG